ncbi:hypothetical protein V8C44DRAFT_323740 [Trichoderma aethiopicum]
MAAGSPRSSKRGRRAKACDSCSRRKIQCDADVPQCNWCRHHDLACTYRRLVANTDRKRSRESPDHKDSQPDAVTQMEILLAQRLSQQDSDAQIDHLASSNSHLRNATSFTGIPLFSERGRAWIESRTGSCMTPQTLCSFGRQWHNPRRLYHDHETAAFNGQPCELPPRATVERYVTVYCSSIVCLVFPVLSKCLFGRTLDLAYQPNDSSSATSARACVYSFLALISILKTEDDSITTIACESYVAAATWLIPQVTQETTGDGLQMLVTMAIVYYFLGDLQSTGLFISIATRLIFALNAHASPDYTTASISPASSPSSHAFPSPSQLYDKGNIAHHLRDLFWTCYAIDKDLCIRTGQPSCLLDLHCDLTLPPDYSMMQSRHIQSPSVPDLGNNTVPMYPWDLRLSQLKSRAYDALYSPMAHRKTQSELLESIRILDESLEQWRLSIPPDIRPTLTFSETTPVSADVSMQSSMIRLAYHHFVAIVHRASGRCKDQLADDYHEGVRSSFNISLDACRSMVKYLRVALHVITDDCFWIVIYYPITTILALFSNILSNPLDESAAGDLEILKSAPTLFKGIPIRKLTVAELTHLKVLDAFSRELARLGELAIQKAKG